MTRMFSFDPSEHAAAYAATGFVHIRHGLTKEFHALLDRQVEQHLEKQRLEKFALGDKQQALYEFPEGGDYHRELLNSVGTVSGAQPGKLVLSERHVKAYDANAAPSPLAHKDRFASEVSVGFSIRVPAGSTLVLYPHDELEVNPFNSSAELRSSLRPETVPENTLRHGKRVDIADSPRDVIMFRGNAIWHFRARPANTVMLYLKLNSWNCDPLGEDPASPDFKARTLAMLAQADDELELAIPLLGRRVDHLERRYNHLWQEACVVVSWGEKPFAIDEHEFRALRAMDGERTVVDVLKAMGDDVPWAVRFEKIRYLASRGAVDLLPAARTARHHGHVANAALAVHA